MTAVLFKRSHNNLSYIIYVEKESYLFGQFWNKYWNISYEIGEINKYDEKFANLG